MYMVAPSVAAFFLAKLYYRQLQLHALDRLLQWNWVNYLGRISYGIYLYHIPVAVYFRKHVFTPLIWPGIKALKLIPAGQLATTEAILKFILFTALTIGVAHLSYRYVEMKLLPLKDKWFK
jgi:peptidoglycan/LPS O-acetylase OafA/YrhL